MYFQPPIQQQAHFNSIKVQLKLLNGQFELVAVVYFNSIKVQLKPQKGQALRKVLIFQFHKGTIKTRNNQLPTASTEISIP